MPEDVGGPTYARLEGGAGRKLENFSFRQFLEIEAACEPVIRAKPDIAFSSFLDAKTREAWSEADSRSPGKRVMQRKRQPVGEKKFKFKKEMSS